MHLLNQHNYALMIFKLQYGSLKTDAAIWRQEHCHAPLTSVASARPSQHLEVLLWRLLVTACISPHLLVLGRKFLPWFYSQSCKVAQTNAAACEYFCPSGARVPMIVAAMPSRAAGLSCDRCLACMQAWAGNCRQRPRANGRGRCVGTSAPPHTSMSAVAWGTLMQPRCVEACMPFPLQ